MNELIAVHAPAARLAEVDGVPPGASRLTVAMGSQSLELAL